MSNNHLPIKMSSGRRLIISNVTDDASYSARRLSFNAKELRFISEELAKWLSDMYGEDVDADLSQSLISGVILLTIIEKYIPKYLKDDKWNREAAPYSFKARDNIRIFANVCVRLGMRRSDVCNYSNFEKSDLKQITATLCAFAKLGVPKGLKKVQEDLEQYVESSYNDRFVGMDSLEEDDEFRLTDEEVASLERARQEEEQKRQEQERLNTLASVLQEEASNDVKRFDVFYNRAIEAVCSDLADIEIPLEGEEEEDVEPVQKRRSAADIHEQVSTARAELEKASEVLEELRTKREAAVNEGAKVDAVDEVISGLEKKVTEVNGIIAKEEEAYQRALEEERLEEKRRQLEEEERRRKEEEERKRKEEEERKKKEEEERKRMEEEKRRLEEEKQRQEEERRRLEEERQRQEEERKQLEEEKRRHEEEKRRQEEERRRQEEQKRLEEERQRQEEEERQRQEEERKRMEEEAERKRQEEAEKKRQEEEAEKVRIELERQAQEEQERIRREEEEAAKKCRGCRNRRPKEAEETEEE